MKKIIYTLFAITTIYGIAACGSSKEARTEKREIAGTWELNSVVAEGITGKIKAQILEEAASACFERSIWKFNQSTHLGSYEIVQNSGECVAKKQDIRWSIYEEKGMPIRLQYKKVDSKYYKDIEAGKVGFRFTIVNVDKTSMQLKSEIEFEGKPAYFVYSFTKR
jgi:hypothetical protein